MVIRGNTRGNANQLARYLVTKGDNEHIRILDVNGRIDPTEQHLFDALFSMGLTQKLTNSEKGIYHAQINPNPKLGEDKSMSDEQWLEAADILGKELGLEDQRRVIVMHTKKGRTHAHIAWERYDHEKGIMRSDSFSRLAQDRARQEMERVFEHEPTPYRNKHQPEVKATLSQLWRQTGTGAQFIKAARDNNYIITQGSGRAAFMVVDEHGRSFNLTRQLGSVKVAEVRQRLSGESLMGEKEGISLGRLIGQEKQTRISQEKEKQQADNQELFTSNLQSMADKETPTGQANIKSQQAANSRDITTNPAQQQEKKSQFKQNSKDLQQKNPQKEGEKQDKAKLEFKANADEIDPRRLAMREKLAAVNKQREQNRQKGMEYD